MKSTLIKFIVLTIACIILATIFPATGFSSPDRIEILDTQMKVIKRYTDWTKCAWLVKLKNKTKEHLRLSIYIDYLDEQGFKIDDSWKSVTLNPDEEKVFSDTCPPFLNDVFSQIKSFNVIVKEN